MINTICTNKSPLPAVYGQYPCPQPQSRSEPVYAGTCPQPGDPDLVFEAGQ